MCVCVLMGKVKGESKCVCPGLGYFWSVHDALLLAPQLQLHARNPFDHFPRSTSLPVNNNLNVNVEQKKKEARTRGIKAVDRNGKIYVNFSSSIFSCPGVMHPTRSILTRISRKLFGRFQCAMFCACIFFDGHFWAGVINCPPPKSHNKRISGQCKTQWCVEMCARVLSEFFIASVKKKFQLLHKSMFRWCSPVCVCVPPLDWPPFVPFRFPTRALHCRKCIRVWWPLAALRISAGSINIRNANNSDGHTCTPCALRKVGLKCN